MKELNSVFSSINKDMKKEQKVIKQSLKEGKIFLLRPTHSYSFDKPVFSVEGDIFSRNSCDYKYQLNEDEIKRYFNLIEANKKLNQEWNRLKEDIQKRNK